jgi:toxin-antitoxin system PIN domain toxin
MTSYCPDVNVWVALSDEPHPHNRSAWHWLNTLPRDSRILFARYSNLGLLRLLTNPSVMGNKPLSLAAAWKVYDDWLADPRVGMYPEPDAAEPIFRGLTMGREKSLSTHDVGDCYLLAFAMGAEATLVTFDRALVKLARRSGCKALSPAALP